MAISKRKRFEIFKRDGFACRYCGNKPPHVVLELDHIIPRSKGGDDHPSNLIASCFACNRGKSNVELNQIIPALEVDAAEAKERLAQLKAYRRFVENERKEREKLVALVIEALDRDKCDDRDRRAIGLFLDRLDIEETLRAADIATRRKEDPYTRWKYFCGICWSMIREREGNRG